MAADLPVCQSHDEVVRASSRLPAPPFVALACRKVRACPESRRAEWVLKILLSCSNSSNSSKKTAVFGATWAQISRSAHHTSAQARDRGLWNQGRAPAALSPRRHSTRPNSQRAERLLQSRAVIFESFRHGRSSSKLNAWRGGRDPSFPGPQVSTPLGPLFLESSGHLRTVCGIFELVLSSERSGGPSLTN